MKALDCNLQWASDNWQGTFAQRAMRFRQLARCRCTACKTDLTIVKVPLHICFHTLSNAKRHCCDSPLKPQNDILFMQPFMSIMSANCFHAARNTHNLRIGIVSLYFWHLYAFQIYIPKKAQNQADFSVLLPPKLKNHKCLNTK